MLLFLMIRQPVHSLKFMNIHTDMLLLKKYIYIYDLDCSYLPFPLVTSNTTPLTAI